MHPNQYIVFKGGMKHMPSLDSYSPIHIQRFLLTTGHWVKVNGIHWMRLYWKCGARNALMVSMAWENDNTIKTAGLLWCLVRSKPYGMKRIKAFMKSITSKRTQLHILTRCRGCFFFSLLKNLVYSKLSKWNMYTLILLHLYCGHIFNLERAWRNIISSPKQQ